jgi:hypothetical protein
MLDVKCRRLCAPPLRSPMNPRALVQLAEATMISARDSQLPSRPPRLLALAGLTSLSSATAHSALFIRLSPLATCCSPVSPWPHAEAEALMGAA